jgi:AcrR family transcriptional regulator/predicted RNA-binding Zn-ribbon protein involved in translation (DUF1610 family)
MTKHSRSSRGSLSDSTSDSGSDPISDPVSDLVQTSAQPSTTVLRRQPKQKRGQERIEKILDAAAAVFGEVGYGAATTHLIAARAGTAIGSLYQFFPDKAAIFKAMELRHIERVKALWAGAGSLPIETLPLQQFIQTLLTGVVQLFEYPVSRVIFVQFFQSREMFQLIDDSMTEEAIAFTMGLFHRKQPQLPEVQRRLLAEVCVHSSNAVMLAALCEPDEAHRQQLIQQIEALFMSYLSPHLGDEPSQHVMKVMKSLSCPNCQSSQLSRNGYRRGKQCYRCKDCGRQFVGNSGR